MGIVEVVLGLLVLVAGAAVLYSIGLQRTGTRAFNKTLPAYDQTLQLAQESVDLAKQGLELQREAISLHRETNKLLTALLPTEGNSGAAGQGNAPNEHR